MHLSRQRIHKRLITCEGQLKLTNARVPERWNMPLARGTIMPCTAAIIPESLVSAYCTIQRAWWMYGGSSESMHSLTAGAALPPELRQSFSPRIVRMHTLWITCSHNTVRRSISLPCLRSAKWGDAQPRPALHWCLSVWADVKHARKPVLWACPVSVGKGCVGTQAYTVLLRTLDAYMSSHSTWMSPGKDTCCAIETW